MPRPRKSPDEEGRTAIQVIERMVSLLDALAEQPDSVSLKDLSARTGTPIYSVTDGTVAMARSYYGYGNLVIIKTPTGKRLLYAHQSRILVKKGKQVAAGEMIGRVGSTGYSTGPHLHFEVRTDKDRAFDPTKFLGVGKAQLQKRANLLDRLR